MKPNKPPAWMDPAAAEAQEKKRSRPRSEAAEAKRRVSEGEEFERRRKGLRKLSGFFDEYPTQTDMSAAMGVQRNTITRWENGRLEIPNWAWILLNYMEKENREQLAIAIPVKLETDTGEYADPEDKKKWKGLRSQLEAVRKLLEFPKAC